MSKKIPVGKRVSWFVNGRKSMNQTSGKVLAYVNPGEDILSLIPEELCRRSRQKKFRERVSKNARYLVVLEKISDVMGIPRKEYYAPSCSVLETAYWGVDDLRDEN